MEILELVDKLEAMAAQARKTPITGRAKIDAEKLLELTELMRGFDPAQHAGRPRRAPTA